MNKPFHQKPFWDIPQNTQAEIRCIYCKAPLTGGLDTYGPQKFERCQAHFLDGGHPPEAAEYYRSLMNEAREMIAARGPLRSQRAIDKMEADLQPFAEKLDKLLEAYPTLAAFVVPHWVYGSFVPE